MPPPLPPPADTTLLGESPAFVTLLEEVSRIAAISKPVLVSGARGTGMELIAARLHYLSPRWQGPLVKLNCAALTESLLESELFGHEAGAFTGATRRHIGRFEQADGGTLFLDELGNVALRVQEKILRAVEYGEFQRVGGAQTINVDVRIVGATNEDLRVAVRDGRFRADLLDRLAFEVLAVPPLRVRSEDVEALADHFAIEVTRELGREYFAGFSADARASLLAHDWPGNVRELKNAIERSVYRTAPGTPVTHIVLDPFADSFALRADAAALPAAQPPNAEAPEPPSPLPSLPCDLKQEVARLETALLERALVQARHRQTEAATLLGLTYHQLRALLRKHGLITPRAPGGARKQGH